MADVKEQIRQLAKQYLQEIIEYRRHIHMHPELAFEEHETSAFITKKLTEFGIPFTSGVAKTGVVALLEGRGVNGRVVAARADMDALPILEQNEVPYKSVHEGKMHACGHDVHTASLLGAARILSELREQLPGTVKFIFQPAEEKLPGGASVMIKEGVLENPAPKSIIGQHVLPGLEAGKVGFRGGMYMASADEIYLTIKGKGGHAALPHLNTDPVLIMAHVLTALQQVVSRNSNPFVPSVLSFGKVTAAGATNIIPDEVRLEGTFRTMDEQWRERAHVLIREIAEKTAAGMGGACEVRIDKGYPCVVNDESLTQRAKRFAQEFLGEERVTELEMRMTAEDFAFYTQQMPGCFYRLGTGNISKNITSGLHTSTFDIDESALETGAGLMAWLIWRELGEGRKLEMPDW